MGWFGLLEWAEISFMGWPGGHVEQSNLQFAEKLLILNEKPRSILKFEGHPEMMCNFPHLTMNGKHITYIRIASS